MTNGIHKKGNNNFINQGPEKPYLSPKMVAGLSINFNLDPMQNETSPAGNNKFFENRDVKPVDRRREVGEAPMSLEPLLPQENRGTKRQGEPCETKRTKNKRSENYFPQTSISHFPISDLPKEILQLILESGVCTSYTSAEATGFLIMCKRVSIIWNKIIKKVGDFSEFDRRNIFVYIEKHIDSKNMILRGSEGWGDNDIGIIQKYWPQQFETLVVDFYNKMTLKAFDFIVQCTKIKSLTIERGNLIYKSEENLNYKNLRNLTHLKQLNLQSMNCIISEIANIVKACPCLEELILREKDKRILDQENELKNFIHNEKDKCVQPIYEANRPLIACVFACIRQLEYLKHLTFVYPGDLHSIDELEQLETLFIDTWLRGVPLLTQFLNLRRLGLWLCDIEVDLINFMRLTELRELSLVVDSTEGKVINLNLPRLNKLSLEGFGIGQIASLSQLKNLEYFTVNNTKIETTPALPVTLKSLELINCPIKMPPPIDHLTSLERFVMQGHRCNGLSDDYELALTKIKEVKVSTNIPIPLERGYGF